jgi:hypothetical protein
MAASEDAARRGASFGVWTRYLAVAVFAGNAISAFLNLVFAGRMGLAAAAGDWSASGYDAGAIVQVALNLLVAFAAMALAFLIAAPGRGVADLRAKLLAGLVLVAGGWSLLSLIALVVFQLTGQLGVSLVGQSAEQMLMFERAVHLAFFNVGMVALAILVLFSRAGARDGPRH